MDKKDVKIEIKADDITAQGVFSNFLNITHSPEEFFLDFLYINPTPPGFGKLASRVVITPGHAKRILMALEENLKNYEAKFGDIKIIQPPNPVKESIQ